MVAALLLIVLGVGASVATVQYMNKQWSTSSNIYNIDTTNSYIRVKPDGSVSIMIQLQNVGTSVAYIKKIVIADRAVEIVFSGAKAYVAFWPIGKIYDVNVATSSFKANVGPAWLVIPGGQSAYLSCTASDVGAFLSAGTSYAVTIFAYGVGQVLTFRLVVQQS